MKILHRIHASILLRKAKRQRRKLDRFIQESAREICSWRQEIAFLESDANQHLAAAGVRSPAPAEDIAPDKVVHLTSQAA